MSGFWKAVSSAGKKILTGGKQKTYGTGAIKSFKASVGDKSLSKLKIARAKSKGSTGKLEQTLWEVKHKKREERFTFAYDRGNVAKKSKKKD